MTENKGTSKRTSTSKRPTVEGRKSTAARAAEVGAAVPEDRKPPASDVKAQAEGAPVVVEAHGQTWTITQEALNDLEVLEAIAELDAGNVAALPAALRGLLGDEGYVAAKKLLRDPDTGRVALDVAAGFYRELLTAANPS